jgi:hypothetical protein
VVDLKRSPDDLIKLLGPIASYDAQVAGLRRLFGAITILALLGSVFVYFGSDVFLFSRALRVASLVGLVTLMLGAGWIWRWARNADVSDNLRDTALPALQILREDFARLKQMSVHLDLSLPLDKRKSQGKGEPYAHGRYSRVVDETFQDPWMSVEAVLNDGAHLAWRIVDSIRVRSRRKSNARGKTKFNTQHTKKTSIDVQLTLRRKDFDVVAGAEVQVKSNEKRHVVSVSRKLRAATLDPIAPTAIIDLVADAYRSVRRTGTEASV